MSVQFTLHLCSTGDLMLSWKREDSGLFPATGEWVWGVSSGGAWPDAMHLLCCMENILKAAREDVGRLNLVGGLHGGSMCVGSRIVTEIDGRTVTKWEEACALWDMMKMVFPTYRMEAAA